MVIEKVHSKKSSFTFPREREFYWFKSTFIRVARTFFNVNICRLIIVIDKTRLIIVIDKTVSSTVVKVVPRMSERKYSWLAVQVLTADRQCYTYNMQYVAILRSLKEVQALAPTGRIASFSNLQRCVTNLIFEESKIFEISPVKNIHYIYDY